MRRNTRIRRGRKWRGTMTVMTLRRCISSDNHPTMAMGMGGLAIRTSRTGSPILISAPRGAAILSTILILNATEILVSRDTL